jgi:hypothetical protein
MLDSYNGPSFGKGCTMTRTATHPPDHRGMWRRLVGRAHPDAGGDDDLFIWAVAVRDVVCSSSLHASVNPEPEDHPSRRREASTAAAPDRVPFDRFADLEVLTDRALSMAESSAEPLDFLLTQVADCYAVVEGPLYNQQRRGATYRTLAAIGHTVAMSKAERVGWYRIAETIPLSQRHASHILSRLKGQAA